MQVTRRISKDEQRQMEKMVIIRGEKRNVEKLVGRRKYKKTYEYEVKVRPPSRSLEQIRYFDDLCRCNQSLEPAQNLGLVRAVISGP